MISSNKNNYFKGNLKDFNDTQGWFLGQFMGEKGLPKLQSEKVEIGWKKIPKGFTSKKHYHKKALEINIVVEGSYKLKIDDNTFLLKRGDFLVVHPYCVAECIDSETGAEVIVIKTPSVSNDKYEL